jgi:hypothetical protein
MINKSNIKWFTQVVVLAVLFSMVSCTQAAVALVSLVSNIGNGELDQRDFSTASSVYQSFTTGSSAANIYEISLFFGSIGNPAIEVSLNADASGSPGSALASSSFAYFPGSPASFQANTFKGNYSVAANSTYWVKVAATGVSSSDNWLSYTDDAAETGSAGWSIGNSHLYGESTSPLFTSSRSIRMEITGAPVPEPSVACLLGLGLGALALVRRRSRA